MGEQMNRLQRAFRILAGGALALQMVTAANAAELKKMVVGVGADPSLAHTYVAKLGGFFEKNGLDVQLVHGSSAAETVPMLIGNQINATIAAEASGISNHQIDGRIVALGEVLRFKAFYGLAAKDATTLEGLKGKRIAVDNASNSGILWNEIVAHHHLNAADYTVVQVQPPEMLAALQRGDVDSFVSWEPWLTRAADLENVRILETNENIMDASTYILMNKDYVDANPDLVNAYLKAMIEATDFINQKPDEAATLTAKYLKLDETLTKSLMQKLEFRVLLNDASVAKIEKFKQNLANMGRLKGTFDVQSFVYPGPLQAVAPDKVSLTK